MATGSGTRELIIDAARALMLNKGLVRATTDEIARTAGVSEGTIYNHFSNKEELFRYTLNELPSGFVRLMRGLHERVGSETVPAVLSRVAAALEFFAEAVPMGASFSPTRNCSPVTGNCCCSAAPGRNGRTKQWQPIFAPNRSLVACATTLIRRQSRTCCWERSINRSTGDNFWVGHSNPTRTSASSPASWARSIVRLRREPSRAEQLTEV